MKKILSFTLSFVLLISLFPFQVAASTNTEDIQLSEQAQSIFDGRKVSLEETLSVGSDVIEGRYVVFTKETSTPSKVMRAFSNDIQITTEIPRTYGNSKAFSIALEETSNNKKTIQAIHAQEDVIAIIPVKRMEKLAVNVPNDPKFPVANSYSLTNQWYLNEPASGNYGIDILRAWDAMDGTIDETVNYADNQTYGGTSDIVIAVIDTGVAFENYDDDGDGLKYDEYSEMTTPSGWDFDKSPDMTDLIYANATETDFNQADETIGATNKFCLDVNTDLQCITGDGDKPGRYFDDKFGVNFLDYIWYWVQDNYWTGSVTGSACTNVGYTDYICVTDRFCNQTGLDNTDYYGCFESEMGHPNDTDGHGTAVTNIIAGKVNNSTSGTGIAPGVSILPIQVFGYQYLTTYWGYHTYDGSSDIIAEAINYAVDEGVDVINLSLGGGASLDMELAAFNAYVNNDIVVVAASGNTGNSSYVYPASYDSVISVGASKQDGTRASYSTYNDKVEIVAPVENGGIPVETYNCFFSVDSGNHSCMGDDTQANIDPTDPSFPPDLFSSAQFTVANAAGTSFSSPQVAAVAGLLRSKYPAWDAEQVRYMLKMSVSEFPTEISSQIGYGVLNANNAVQAINGQGGDLTSKHNIIQTIRGTNNGVYTRQSSNSGIEWTAWTHSGWTKGNITSITSNANEVQALRGTNDGVYTRITSSNGNTWTDWKYSGATLNDIEMFISGSNLIQSVRGTNNGIYTRYSTNNGTSWSNWSNSGKTGSKPQFINSGTNLIQTTQGINNELYTRYSTDNGMSWNSWINAGGTIGSPSLIVSGNNTIQSLRGTNNGIYTRYSTDNGVSWSGWENSGKTIVTPTFINSGANIIQSTRGVNNELYTRYSTDDGASWSGWENSGGTLSIPTLTVSGNNTIQSIRGTNNGIYTRYSTDNGVTWSGWENSGGTKDAPFIYYDSSFLRTFQNVRGTNDSIYVRYSNDNGVSWSKWYPNGQTLESPQMHKSVY